MEVAAGESILEHTRKLGGVEIDSECGGQGVCGKCAVRSERGAECFAAPTRFEQDLRCEGGLPEGQRPACPARVTRGIQNIRVFIPDFGKHTIPTDIVETGNKLNRCVFMKDDRLVYRTGEDLVPYLGKMLGLAVDVGTTTLVTQ